LLPEFKIQAQPFTEWVVQTWAPSLVKEGETVRFFATLEPRFQRIAERHLRALVASGAVPPEYEAGAVMMTGEGRVRAMIGGVDWSERQFNTAVKGNVQPGSTAKLPLLVAACEAGKKPESRVLDLPLVEDWPSNGELGYRGPTTLKEAFAFSRNAAAVRLAQELGVRKVAEASRRLGIEPGPDPDPGFVLGTFSTNVLTMTAAYAAVANGGYRVAPTGVLAVVDGRGQVRANFLDADRVRVVPERCVQPTRAMLNEVVRSGTGSGARLRRWQAYGKTGTSTGNADAWFIGWSEGRVLGIWMGKRRDAAGEALAGRGAPADLFRRVSNTANEMMEYRAGKAPGRGERQLTQAGPDRRKPSGKPKRLAPVMAQANGTEEVGSPHPGRRHPKPTQPSWPAWDHDLWPGDRDDLPGHW
jgi:penicillin-binding protein 1A